tara:strand:+ start:380 stop:601 length:222 start_codon:yes stop_codon:yes gene_type:complete
MGKLLTISSLKSEQLDLIKKLEKKLNICLISFSEVDTPSFRNLSKSEISEVKKLEEKLNIKLLAYDQVLKKAG